MKQDHDTLLKLHNELKHIPPFKIRTEDKKIFPDILQDIISLQTRYKLTRKIFLENDSIANSNYFSSPMLYDLTCMIPFFDDENKNAIIHLNNTVSVFILLPIDDFRERGEAINNTILSLNGGFGLFFVLGEKYGLNEADTSVIVERSLYSKGIDKKNIINLPVLRSDLDFEDFKNAMQNIMLIIYSFCSPDNFYLCSSKNNVSDVLKHVKILRYLGLVENKFKFIC